MTRIITNREPIDPGKIVRNPKVASEWKKLWDCCWLCPSFMHSHRQRFNVHHIIGGSRRSDEVCNFVHLCEDCHTFIEQKMEPDSSVRLCVRLKQLWDPCRFKKERIEALFGRRIDQ